jgi:signal transduction histidine kinase
MIYKLWVQILFIIGITSLPIAFFGQHFQKSSTGVIARLYNSHEVEQIVADYAKNQKKLSNFDPTNTETYKQNYLKAEQLLETMSDIDTVSQPLVAELNRGFLLKIAAILVCSVMLSFFVAKAIVRHFNRLLRKATELEHKQLEVANLANWQQIAKSLVHEIRAPIAPIKLVVSGISSKKEQYTPEKFYAFISDAAQIVLEQIAYFERMIENFTAFAKLPEPVLKPVEVGEFLKTLAIKFGDEPSFSLENHAPENLITKRVEIDANLIDRLIVNIVRNSREANANQLEKHRIQLSLTANTHQLLMSIQNNGEPIPEKNVLNLFAPKPPSASGKNFGIGLLICKKIAVSHGGDLILSSNSASDGVTFTLSLPMKV